MTEVEHDTAAHRFSAEVDGQRAVLDYTLVDDVMTITHTGVPAAIGRRGIAGELMRAALQLARESHWKVVPACSYAAAYLRKHGDHDATHGDATHGDATRGDDEARRHQEELLDEALEETFPASDPPAVGMST